MYKETHLAHFPIFPEDLVHILVLLFWIIFTPRCKQIDSEAMLRSLHLDSFQEEHVLLLMATLALKSCMGVLKAQ